LLKDESGWALRSVLPTNAFEYDRKTYRDQDFVVLLDGTSAEAKARLLGILSAARLVMKISDPGIKARLEAERGARRIRGFVSFTITNDAFVSEPDESIVESVLLDEEAALFFKANGFESGELAQYFSDGARWFGVRLGSELVAACFCFRNFGRVFEIGGVFTKPEFRRRGFGRRVVAAALRRIFADKNLPRYQVRDDNVASIGLAEAAGLRRFLHMEHLFLDNLGRPRS
jgi:ribosomal protein S18 acetylase RimI-like enzyme